MMLWKLFYKHNTGTFPLFASKVRTFIQQPARRNDANRIDPEEVGGHFTKALKRLEAFVNQAVNKGLKEISDSLPSLIDAQVNDFKTKITKIQNDAISQMQSQSHEIYARLKSTEERVKSKGYELYILTAVGAGLLFLGKKELNKTLEDGKRIKDDLENVKKELNETLEEEKRNKADLENIKKDNDQYKQLLNKPLSVTFNDTKDNTDYDKAIMHTKTTIKASHDPCQSFEMISQLIATLNIMKSNYMPRPCIAGGCLGVFTPHRDRIDRRIERIKEEKTQYEVNCDIYKKISKQ